MKLRTCMHHLNKIRLEFAKIANKINLSILQIQVLKKWRSGSLNVAYRCVKGSLKNHLQEKNYAKGDCTKKTCLYIGAIP